MISQREVRVGREGRVVRKVRMVREVHIYLQRWISG